MSIDHAESQPANRQASVSRRTLYQDLIAGIILVVAGVFAVVASLAYVYISHQSRIESVQTLTEFSDYLIESLELPVWNYDEEGIGKICNAFFENILVERLMVADSEGRIFFEKQRRPDSSSKDLERSTEIVHSGQRVGHLVIALNTAHFREKQKQFMWLVLVSLVVVILVLVATLRIVLRLFMIKPLDQLIQRTEQISRGEYDTVYLQAPQREIQTIVSRFNHMAVKIQRREKSLKKVNRQLEREILEHREAEAALRNSQQELDSIIRSTPDIIYRLDTSGRFTFVSDAVRRYGVRPEDLIGTPFLDYIHEDDHDNAKFRINERRTGSRGTKRLSIHAFGDYCRPRKPADQTVASDPVFLVDAEGLYVTGESGMQVFVGTQGIARDISAQRKMESARMESEDRLLLALEVSGAGIWQLDLRSNVLTLDERIYSLLGYSAKETIQDGFQFLKSKTTPETWETLQQKFRRHISGKATVFDHEFRLRSHEGQWRWFHTKARVVRFNKAGKPESMVGIIIDTSERKESEAERERLELKLQQAQKMEAIGTLAGGIAHDFNNILGAIFGYTQLTQMHAGNNQRIKGYVDNIFKASERAKGLVEQILTFTRQGKSQKVPCDIAIVLKEALRLIRASIPVTIRIAQQIPTGLGMIMADQTQIHQVLMNLCTNAAHAMEASGGELGVSLEAITLSEVTSPQDDDLPPGRYLALSVKDTGTGMENVIVDRIFEPYFTTKDVGEGTGMGLATVHGIVSDHGGHISVESKPGQGSRFRVLFPVLETQAMESPAGTGDYPRGKERILFVDDEEVLVTVGVEMLKDLGYQAVGTTSATHALELFVAEPQRFDLIITDMTMPDLTGDQLAAKVLDYRSDIPIIICTGYSKRMSAERAKALGIQAFLMKPMSVQKLSRTIREILDQPLAD